jgi:hypothetical protein
LARRGGEGGEDGGAAAADVLRHGLLARGRGAVRVEQFEGHFDRDVDAGVAAGAAGGGARRVGLRPLEAEAAVLLREVGVARRAGVAGRNLFADEDDADAVQAAAGRADGQARVGRRDGPDERPQQSAALGRRAARGGEAELEELAQFGHAREQEAGPARGDVEEPRLLAVARLAVREHADG